ncbi:hypothetical protein K488DRAFT_41723 [Vararia minispora EC-137]|uniref:Uncharacterized protein n=1 Tax=Vararia minispora EC-137 TaxID=1314806 RepID=A0ACB8QWI0_9AGAM|nr:hypothetical protein K488DRAFT_41723 [Vararia minispora EC-137]
MASLLQRMNIDVGSIGPDRAKPRRSHSTSPYSRPPKGDINAQWTHDQFTEHNSLLERMRTVSHTTPPRVDFVGVGFGRAVRAATSQAPSSISIRGASNIRNVVEVSGLVKGTTPDDVQAIFKQCGAITEAKAAPSQSLDGVTVRLTFKAEKDALEAVRKFHKQVADGRELSVTIVGGSNTTLPGRLRLGTESDSVDDVMSSSSLLGPSKMRSDELLQDPEERARAHIQVAPPGADVRDYLPTAGGRGRGRGGRRRGGVRHRGGRGGGERMDTD